MGELKKKVFLNALIVVALMAVLSCFASAAAAAATLKAPATSTYHSTTMAVSCETGVTAVTNATILYALAGGANTSIYIANTSADQTNFSNVAVDISAAADSASYIFTCVMTGTNVTHSAAVTGVTIDNTAPTCVLGMVPSKYISQQEQVKIQCTCRDNLASSPGIARNLTKPNGAVVTTSNEVNVFSGSDTGVLGVYIYRCGIGDDAQNSNSVTYTFTVQSEDDMPIDEIVQTATSAKRANLVPIIAGIIVVFLIIAFAIGANRKK